MKLGDVLKKERIRRGLVGENVAAGLGLAPAEYERVESGESPAERWAPVLGRLAVVLEIPTSRLLAESGRYADTRPGQAGRLIERRRREFGLDAETVAPKIAVASDEYAAIERGESPIETYGPLLLGFAEIVELPVFNLLHPCGLPLEKITDYA